MQPRSQCSARRAQRLLRLLARSAADPGGVRPDLRVLFQLLRSGGRCPSDALDPHRAVSRLDGAAAWRRRRLTAGCRRCASSRSPHRLPISSTPPVRRRPRFTLRTQRARRSEGACSCSRPSSTTRPARWLSSSVSTGCASAGCETNVEAWAQRGHRTLRIMGKAKAGHDSLVPRTVGRSDSRIGERHEGPSRVDVTASTRRGTATAGFVPSHASGLATHPHC